MVGFGEFNPKDHQGRLTAFTLQDFADMLEAISGAAAPTFVAHNPKIAIEPKSQPVPRDHYRRHNHNRCAAEGAIEGEFTVMRP